MYPPTYSLSQGFVNQFPKDYDGADMYMYSNTVLESLENSHLKNGHTCNYTFLIFFLSFFLNKSSRFATLLIYKTVRNLFYSLLFCKLLILKQKLVFTCKNLSASTLEILNSFISPF